MLTPRSLVLVIFLLAGCSTLWAQPGGGGDPGGGEPVPFTGLELLMTAGALLGAKTLYNRRKKPE